MRSELSVDRKTALADSLRIASACMAVFLASCKPPTPTDPVAELEPFPPDDPALWVCADSPIEQARIDEWCAEHPDRGRKASLPAPVPRTDLGGKNAYDRALLEFLSEHRYRELGWVADQRWRLTGPIVGPIKDSNSYGVHPAVRVWYSPEVVDWMCADRAGELPDGSMIVKEMHGIDASELGIDPAADCMRLDKDPAEIDPGSWTVMVRAAGADHDGWYWANPSTSVTGNPPILDRSAVTSPTFFDALPGRRNPDWYPTGALFGQYGHYADIVTPYSQFGGLCINCHASAVSESTFASLDNVVGEGIRYRHFRANPTDAMVDRTGGAEHEEIAAAESNQKPDWGFAQPRKTMSAGFAAFFGTLGPDDFAQALDLRLPAETYDHKTADAGGPGAFVTSNQCIGCHDATVSNAETPNMLIPKPGSPGVDVNVSPYAESRASPMGLAGRDPVFFSQLQSETNNLPELSACIENTCLHCHGVMGQREFAQDTASPAAECSELFVDPPADIPFGKPFRLSQVSHWTDDGQEPAKYGNLARDGISCAVCHHISAEGLSDEQRNTGNFATGPDDELYGPYQSDSVVTRPMENALGIRPLHGGQVSDSALCSSCHNILLPVLDNDGQAIKVATIDGKDLFNSYEQTTGLEWENSVFSQSGTFRSCQDCHMPRDFAGERLEGILIANIESEAFAPTENRLPDADITLTPRDEFGRHSLHGLNVFLNQMFQQFPLLLGIRQIDYAGAIQPSTQPALVTGCESMLRMARDESADVEITSLAISTAGKVEAEVLVTNKAGHYLPSGVGFRRAFVEFVVNAEDGPLWASGRTNELGVILDGTGNEILPTEYGRDDSTLYQPHHEVITSGDQVQIYQELIRDSAGILTTSFLRRAHTVKDNRLRPKGFDAAFYEANASPYVKYLAEELRELPSYADPYYSDPQLTGADRLVYRFSLDPTQVKRISSIDARLYSQSIPPFYLQQRFNDASAGPGEKREIQRLYYLASHLNTDESTPIEDWKLLLAAACRRADGSSCHLRVRVAADYQCNGKTVHRERLGD